MQSYYYLYICCTLNLKIMNEMTLFKRLIASVIDKLLIIILFLITSFLVLGPWVAPGKLGIYVALLNIKFSNYDYITDASNVDVLFTSIFLILNFLYYVIFECYLGASLGKYLFGGQIINEDNVRINSSIAVGRSSILVASAVIFILARNLLNVSYLPIIVLFFVILDLPILIGVKRQSLLDIVTKTFVIKKK